MLKRKFLIKVLATTIAATMIIAPATAFAEGGATVDATEQDVTESFGDLIENSEYEAAVSVVAGDEHTADVTAGNLTSEDGPGASAFAMQASEIDLTVNGNIDSERNGVSAAAMEDSTTNVVVNGDIKSNDADGIDTEAGSYWFGDEDTDNSTVNVTVNGNVSGYDDGVHSSACIGGTSNVAVNGDVTGDWIGVVSYADENGSTSNVDVTGSVTGDQAGIKTNAYDNATNNVRVGGDVDGKEVGVKMSAVGSGEEKAANNVIIEGTLSAEKAALVSYSEGGTNTLTVWKIETPGYTAATSEYDLETGERTYIEDKEAAKNIQYIIRVNQAEGATLKATDADGNALATVTGVNGNALEYAHEGDKVLLKVDVDDDYRLDAAYGDDGQKLELVKDANGNYYINVPKNGGVSFSVKLTYVGHDEDDDDDDKDKDKNKNVVNAAVNTNVAAAISAISSAPAGGTATVAIAGDKLDASLVATLLSRRDVTVVLTVFIDGKLCTITIPAGSDVASCVSADGSISVSALAEKFGSKAV